MAEPISRTELYWRVDAYFRELYPQAPERLDPRDPAQAEWRQGWIYARDTLLNEEVNRVYWDRFPDAPVQLDADDPAHRLYREAWREIRDEVMAATPEPEDVEPHGAYRDDGRLDGSYLRAGCLAIWVDVAPDVDPELHEMVVGTIEELVQELLPVVAEARVPDLAHTRGTFVQDGTGHGIELEVTAWWDGEKVTGHLGTVVHAPRG